MGKKSKMTKRKWEFENEGEKTRIHIRPQLNIHPYPIMSSYAHNS